MADRVGDDAAVAMTGDQHVDRHASGPRHRHHQQPAVPEGEDERPLLAMMPPRRLAAFDAPAAGCVDEAYVERDERAEDAPQRIRSDDPPAEFRHAATALRRLVRLNLSLVAPAQAGAQGQTHVTSPGSPLTRGQRKELMRGT